MFMTLEYQIFLAKWSICTIHVRTYTFYCSTKLIGGFNDGGYYLRSYVYIYRIEGNFGGCKLWRTRYKSTVGEIYFGEFELL